MASNRSALADCKTVREVSRVLVESVSPQDRLSDLFRGVCDSLRDYRETTESTVNGLQSEVERLTTENQDLKFLLQAEQSQRSEPPTDAALYLAALLQIREIGYGSQAHRATDTVLACLRVCEQAIMEGENYRKRLQDLERGNLTTTEPRMA